MARANPVALRLLYCWLSFVWISFLLGVCISRLTNSISLPMLFFIAVLLSVSSSVCYIFLLYHASAFFYYRILPPLYALSKSPKCPGRIRIWLRRDRWLDLILRSQDWNRRPHYNKQGLHDGDVFEPKGTPNAPPVVIRREHINSHRWISDRTFAIALLFNKIQLARRGDKIILDVDLRDQSCAIYSNRGKQFILSEFLPKNLVEYRSLSQKSHNFLLGRGNETEMDLQFNALRWASGGFLPLAKWKGRQWVCLFFRDIYPIGWNIANGASETKAEYKRLNTLVYRETLEELVITSGSPHKHGHLEHRILNLPGLELRESNLSPLDLIKQHDRLREDHDGILLTPRRGTDLQAKSTRQVVRVAFHEDWRDADPEVTNNVLIAVNPLELGVEIVKVGEFELSQNESILDGEIYSSSKGEYLVRRPIVMISTDYLKECYNKRCKSLGRRPTKEDSDDRKTLGKVPSGEYHLFTEELELRRSRLEELQNTGFSDSVEAKRLRDWAKGVEALFDSAACGQGLKGNLAALLPVTWKSIELAIEQEVL